MVEPGNGEAINFGRQEAVKSAEVMARYNAPLRVLNNDPFAGFVDLAKRTRENEITMDYIPRNLEEFKRIKKERKANSDKIGESSI